MNHRSRTAVRILGTAAVAALALTLLAPAADAGHRRHDRHDRHERHGQHRRHAVHRVVPRPVPAPIRIAPVRVAPRFVVPRTIRVGAAASYRPYYGGSVYYAPHRHAHSSYLFPVSTSAGIVYRPYSYCDGRLFDGVHVDWHGPRLDVHVRF